MDIFCHYTMRFEACKEDEYSIQEYLNICKKDSTVYTAAVERVLTAIGQPELVDTHHDPRLSWLSFSKVIRVCPAFREFYGMEDTVEQIVSSFKHAAQGLEKRKQILYLLGPSDEGEPSLVEKLKSLMKQIPIYTLKGSPIHESPLRLFSPEEDGETLERDYGIPRRYLNSITLPRMVKWLHEFNGNITRFRVVKLHPSILSRIVIPKTEPGDKDNQDISSLVGKAGIRGLEGYLQGDPDAYLYSGGLCLASHGLFEFVEMFKAPIKILHPLLTATQEDSYKGTESFGAVPFDGIILAHLDEVERQNFKSDHNNKAFLDRICIVKVPYCLRMSDEVKTYDKSLRNGSLTATSCAPNTLKMMAQSAVLTHIKEPENSDIFSKIRVRGGESPKDVDPKARSYQEHHDFTGIDEGMTGLSTRFAFRVLSKVFNFDGTEVTANLIHLLYVLGQQIEREQFPSETESKLVSYVRGCLMLPYVEFIGKEIRTSYLKSYSEHRQSIFNRYVVSAGLWIQDQEYHDPDTGEILDHSALNDELEKVEKPAGISNPKDFRNEVVNFVLRARAKSGGKNPVWTSYKKLHTVIEKRMFSTTGDLLPVISFNAESSYDNKRKHENFVSRMVEKGYAQRQVRLLVG